MSSNSDTAAAGRIINRISVYTAAAVLAGVMLLAGTGCPTVYAPAAVSSPDAGTRPGRTVPEVQPDGGRGWFVPVHDLAQLVSFDFNGTSVPDMLRFMNSLTGIDFAIAPEVLEQVRREDRRYTLRGRSLPLALFVNWCARLMNCAYTEGEAPDIWFADENAWIRSVPLTWQSYDNTAISGDDGPQPRVSLIEELQRGLNWARTDTRIIPGRTERTILVNSTVNGHRRLDALLKAFADRRFDRFEQLAVPEPAIDHALLQVRIACPEPEIGVQVLLERITVRTGLNIGYDSSACPAAVIAVPLAEYTAGVLLDRILGSGQFKALYSEGPRAAWLAMKDETPLVRERYVLWESMDLRLFAVGELSRRIRGSDLAAAIKTGVHARTWSQPGTLIRYIDRYNVLLVQNRREVIEDAARFLVSVKTFGKLQTE